MTTCTTANNREKAISDLSKIKVRGNEEDVKDSFRPIGGFAYMIKGVCRAFMDIAYGDSPYPDGFGKFKCEQTKGIELGDDYSEYVVTEA